MISYEIWDIDSGNLVGSFATETEALTLLGEAIARHGEGYANGLVLILDDEEDEIKTLGEGSDLAARAQRANVLVSTGASRP